jgi:hypothetical protein
MIIIGIVCLVSSAVIGFFILKTRNIFDVIVPGIVLVLNILIGVSFTSIYIKAFNEVKFIKKVVSEYELYDESMIRYLNGYVSRMKSMSWYYFLTGLDSIEPIELNKVND